MADHDQHRGQKVVNKVNAQTVGAVVQVGTVTGGVHVSGLQHGFGSVVPRQLPAPPALFTGRDADLVRLTRTVDQTPAGTVVISAVGGAGGVGKTWLVLHWAHCHIDRFPDGQLHVDLRGFSPDSEPMPASVALGGFLCAFGVESAAIPLEEHAQAALFRSLVAGKRNADRVGQCRQHRTDRTAPTGLIHLYGVGHQPPPVGRFDQCLWRPAPGS